MRQLGFSNPDCTWIQAATAEIIVNAVPKVAAAIRTSESTSPRPATCTFARRYSSKKIMGPRIVPIGHIHLAKASKSGAEGSMAA